MPGNPFSVRVGWEETHPIHQRIGDEVVVVGELRKRQASLLLQRFLQVGHMAWHLDRQSPPLGLASLLRQCIQWVKRCGAQEEPRAKSCPPDRQTVV